MINGIYILLIVTHISYGTAAMSQEFYSHDACINAREAILSSQTHISKNEVICVSKE